MEKTFEEYSLNRMAIFLSGVSLIEAKPEWAVAHWLELGIDIALTDRDVAIALLEEYPDQIQKLTHELAVKLIEKYENGTFAPPN